ncbi:hypothetical protein RNJ44_02119 [Nakaseomyces bracarensis]|uniref:Uncharacterized protein n=1 Tax=Nakaseomyces bracarensis TaxID=273131 RepID=A0ABR4NMK6_9SACH
MLSSPWQKIQGNKYLRKDGLAHFVCCYILCTILGNYARQGIESLTTYTPSYITPTTVLWANCGACVIMGILQDLKEPVFNAGGYQTLFLSLTTGFCGSFSSFSTMMLEIFTYSTSLTSGDIKLKLHLPNRAYGMMEFLSVLITHLGISMTSLLFGRQLARDVMVPYIVMETTDVSNASSSNIDTENSDEDNSAEKNGSFEEPVKFIRPWCEKVLFVMDISLTVMSIPIMAMIIVLAGYYENYSRARWTLPCLFGIPGSFLRYYLALWFNNKKYINNYPLGTYIANCFASLMLAVFILIQRGQKNSFTHLRIIENVNTCHVVGALANGFCGSLSTISTFINEVYGKNIIFTLKYYFSTIFTAYCLYVIILGSYAWSKGLTEPVC